jgi:lysophospholipase L1-like esterase
MNTLAVAARRRAMTANRLRQRAWQSLKTPAGQGGSGVFARPDHPAFSYDDFAGGVVLAHDLGRLVRPTLCLSNFQFAAPGSRLRFTTHARAQRLHFRYPGTLTRADAYNDVAEVWVDGAPHTRFVSPGAIGQDARVAIDLKLDGEPRLIEVIFPYCAALDFIGVEIADPGDLTHAPPRPDKKMLVLADSIGQGMFASRTTRTWPFLLAQARGRQLLNWGFGSQRINPQDGLAVAAQTFDDLVIFLGHNDFLDQTPLRVVTDSYTRLISNVRSAFEGDIHCITPIFSTISNKTVDIQNYRDAIGKALTELADPRNLLIDGSKLMAPRANRLLDYSHPNDRGHVEIAANLRRAIADWNSGARTLAQAVR